MMLFLFFFAVGFGEGVFAVLVTFLGIFLLGAGFQHFMMNLSSEFRGRMRAMKELAKIWNGEFSKGLMLTPTVFAAYGKYMVTVRIEFIKYRMGTVIVLTGVGMKGMKKIDDIIRDEDLDKISLTPECVKLIAMLREMSPVRHIQHIMRNSDEAEIYIRGWLGLRHELVENTLLAVETFKTLIEKI